MSTNKKSRRSRTLLSFSSFEPRIALAVDLGVAMFGDVVDYDNAFHISNTYPGDESVHFGEAFSSAARFDSESLDWEVGTSPFDWAESIEEVNFAEQGNVFGDFVSDGDAAFYEGSFGRFEDEMFAWNHSEGFIAASFEDQVGLDSFELEDQGHSEASLFDEPDFLFADFPGFMFDEPMFETDFDPIDDFEFGEYEFEIDSEPFFDEPPFFLESNFVTEDTSDISDIFRVELEPESTDPFENFTRSPSSDFNFASTNASSGSASELVDASAVEREALEEPMATRFLTVSTRIVTESTSQPSAPNNSADIDVDLKPSSNQLQTGEPDVQVISDASRSQTAEQAIDWSNSNARTVAPALIESPSAELALEGHNEGEELMTPRIRELGAQLLQQVKPFDSTSIEADSNLMSDRNQKEDYQAAATVDFNELILTVTDTPEKALAEDIAQLATNVRTLVGLPIEPYSEFTQFNIFEAISTESVEETRGSEEPKWVIAGVPSWTTTMVAVGTLGWIFVQRQIATKNRASQPVRIAKSNDATVQAAVRWANS